MVSQKVMPFSLVQEYTDTGTCIRHQNEAGPLWITSLLLNIITVSLNSIVPPSNEGMCPCFIKFCHSRYPAGISEKIKF